MYAAAPFRRAGARCEGGTGALARVAAVAVLTVTVGVAINQILNGTTLQPLWLITGMMLAALAEPLQADDC